MTERCPCGSGTGLEECCGPLLDGRPAATAEMLMRSRYTAYVLGRHDYLLRTWHPDTRPAPGELGGTRLAWIGLSIVDTDGGLAGDEAGTVRFIAGYRSGGGGKALHESSRFVRRQGAWVYVDGRCQVRDIGRNDACLCDSGRKFKRCCGVNQVLTGEM